MDNENFVILSPRVARIRGLNPGPFTLEGTNCYIVGTGAERVLIDCSDGVNEEWQPFLTASLKKLGVQSLSHILITHSHNKSVLSKPCDHSGGVLATLEAVRSKPRIFKFPREGEDCDFEYEALADGMVFDLPGANVNLMVISTPGHTRDHVCFFLKEESAIFSGDLVIGKGTTKFEDLSQLMASFDKLLQFQPAKLYTGKGPVIDGKAESLTKIQEIKRHRMEREEQIAKLIQADLSTTVQALVCKMYQGYPAEVLPFAMETVEFHIEKLIAEKRVQRNVDGSLQVTRL